MKKLLFLLGILFAEALPAYANSNARGWCEVGNQPVITSGLTSTTTVQGSYPQCTVTVTIHGGGAATIYSDNANTPLANPFLAQTNGQWLFFAANGRYDVTLTGGGLPSTVTYSDIVLFDSGSTGGVTTSGSPAANQTAYFTSSSQITGTATDTNPSHALFTSATVPAFRAIGAGDLPAGFTQSGGIYATQLALNAAQVLYVDTTEAGLNGCTLVNTSGVITCTSNTFSCPGDLGKTIWAAQSNEALLLADSTITTCTDAKHATASTNGLANAAASTLRFGHDDTPAWDAINTAWNTLTNTQGTCLLTPSGLTTVKHGALVFNPGGASYLDNGPFQPCVVAQGITTFSPTPDFNFTFYNPGTANIQFGWGEGACCKVGGGSELGVMEGIVVDGGLLSSGTGVCNMGGFSQTGIFLAQYTKKVGVAGWCPGVANFTPIIADNIANHFDLQVISSGTQGSQVQGSNPSSPVVFHGGQFYCDPNSAAASISAALFTTSTNSHNATFSCAKTSVQFNGGASTVIWHSDHDSFFQTPTGQTRQVVNLQTGTAWITDCWIQGTTGNSLFLENGAGVTHIKGCTINAAANQFWADTHTVPGGTIYDDGGNNIIGSFASDAIPTGVNGIWGIGTGVATANTTLYLVGRDSTNPAFTNATATTNSGLAAFTGTLANLVCTATVAGALAGSGVVTVRAAPLGTGTFATTGITATFGQTTSAKDQTHTFAITQGQPLQFQVTTQPAETLAGVQCRVSEY